MASKQTKQIQKNVWCGVIGILKHRYSKITKVELLFYCYVLLKRKNDMPLNVKCGSMYYHTYF